MKIAASFLSIESNIKKNIEKLANTNIDYLHLDIMDGNFVNNKTMGVEEISDLVQNVTKKMDVHLMVSDVLQYIDDFSNLKPEFITFHYEAVDNVLDIIKYIKGKNIKAGISIKPNTTVLEIYDYLHHVDLILVMSVEPGAGGQKFIMNSIDKLKQLKEIKQTQNLDYVIQVDGGINSETIKYCKDADIIVVGSYITNSNDYSKQVNILKGI